MIDPWRRLRNIGIALLAVFAIGVGVGVYRNYSRPEVKPPAVDLAGTDPLVARAITSARASVEGEPRSAAAWGKLGMVLFAHDYHAEALECFAEAERLDPADAHWPYYQGMILRLERPDEAIAAFKRAAQRQTYTFAPDLRLAELLLAQERVDEAEAAYRAWDHLDDPGPRVGLGRGKIAQRRGDLKLARALLESSLRSPDSRREASIALVDVLQQLGETAAAERLQADIERLPPDAPWPDPLMNEVIDLQTGTRARLNQVNRLMHAGRTPEALNVIQQILRDDPKSELGQLALGRALMQANDTRSAEAAMAELIRLQPGCIDAHLLRGAALMEMARYEDAAGAFRRVIELSQAHALAHLNLARCLRKTGDRPGAKAAFADAIRCKPDLLPARVEYAEFLLEIGDKAGAIAQLRDAQRLAPGDEKVGKLLAVLESHP